MCFVTGKVIPVIGMSRTIQARMRNDWSPMRIVRPAARYLRKRSRERSAMPNPTVTRNM